MKKLLVMLVVLTLVMASASMVVAESSFRTVGINIDGQAVNIPADMGAVIIYNDRTMVPVRFVAEFLNFTVDWLPETEMVVFANHLHTAVFRIGGYNLLVNAEQTVMDTSAMIYDNRSYIPIRFFAEAVGMEVDWDDATNSALLVR